MSAFAKMLGIDKMLDGIDVQGITAQFEQKMRDDREVMFAIKKMTADIAAIKSHLGIASDEITDVTPKGE